MKEKSKFDKQWILENGIPIAENYNGNITLRALHYRLVALGMTNDVSHYKKVVNSMIEARWEGLIQFDAFMDHERQTIGETRYEVTSVWKSENEAKKQVKLWIKNYSKNRWENQPIYPEVFIEKKALQGVFQETCRVNRIALNPCKGYPSLTFLYDAKLRFDKAIEKGKNPLILYFGDYDPSGEDIPRSIQDNLYRMGTHVELKRIALMEHQVIEWNLPPAPTKSTDTRSGAWDGLGQVELDAVLPEDIVVLCEEAINSVFDKDLYDELLEQEQEEEIEFISNMKDYVKTL